MSRFDEAARNMRHYGPAAKIYREKKRVHFVSKSDIELEISNAHYERQPEFERTSKQFMRAMVRSEKPLRILDVGCGTGLNASYLARAGHTVIGIDLSGVAIEQFKAKGLEGIVCDLEVGPAPFPDESFDMVYASEIIEHCANTRAFLLELHRLLKSEGMLLLSTPNSAFWPYRILALLGRASSEYQHPGHVRFFSKRSLSSAIAAAGFEVAAVSARHMYMVIGKRIGDKISGLLNAVGFQREPRFATGDHFWQLSKFSRIASGLWADTLIIAARKSRQKPAVQ